MFWYLFSLPTGETLDTSEILGKADENTRKWTLLRNQINLSQILIHDDKNTMRLVESCIWLCSWNNWNKTVDVDQQKIITKYFVTIMIYDGVMPKESRRNAAPLLGRRLRYVPVAVSSEFSHLSACPEISVQSCHLFVSTQNYRFQHS